MSEQAKTDLLERTEAYAAVREVWIADAVELLSGDRELSPEVVFAKPMQNLGENREHGQDPQLDAETEYSYREIASRFGIGNEEDETLSEAFLPAGHYNLIEGGLVWKVAAEQAVDSDEAGAYVYAGWQHRRTDDREHAFETDVLHVEADKISNNEYEAVRLVAESHEDFVPLAKPIDLQVGYDNRNNNVLVAKATGQLMQIGTRKGKPVLWLRVDSDPNPDDPKKHINRPDTAALIGFIADYLTAYGDTVTAVGLTTSNSYPSRAIDSIRAGLTRGRQIGVATYGTKTLADIKGEPVAKPLDVKQLNGEFRSMHDRIGRLRRAMSLLISAPSEE